MLRARREARQGGVPQDPRYAQAGGRSRLRDRIQGYPADPFGYDQPQYDQPQQYGVPPDQYGYAQQQQYNQPPPYGQQYGQQKYPQQYGSPQQWPQPSDPKTMYAPQQWAQQPAPPYPGYEVSSQQSQPYAPQQLTQLPPNSNGSRPCVIPQMTHKRFSGENMSPFVRARVPELETLISSHELIVFIDELNEAFMANPALQATNNVANVAGMAPSMMVQMIGMGVNVAAGIGSSVTTKVRTKNYLAYANESLFHPKGLHVQMCKTDKMLEYVGLGGQQNVFLKQQYRNAFESAQQVPVPVSGVASEDYNHPIMQRMGSLGNRVMGLSFENVEAATAPDGFWKKWGTKEASKAEQKQQEKMMMKDKAKEERRAGWRGGRGSSRRQERKDEKKAKEAKKILWIVITAKEESAGGDDEWDSGSEDDAKH